MLGIAKGLADELEARGYTDADVARIFGPKAYAGELRIIYSRGNDGDLTSPLPSSRHAYYYGAKGWVAVAIADDPEQSGEQLVDVPAFLQEHGRNDRMALWSRKDGRDTMNASCKHAAKMLSSGWSFVEVCCPDRLRDLAEARIPRTPEPIENSAEHTENEAPARNKKAAR